MSVLLFNRTDAPTERQFAYVENAVFILINNRKLLTPEQAEAMERARQWLDYWRDKPRRIEAA